MARGHPIWRSAVQALTKNDGMNPDYYHHLDIWHEGSLWLTVFFTPRRCTMYFVQ
jgi:hypothetical protein